MSTLNNDDEQAITFWSHHLLEEQQSTSIMIGKRRSSRSSNNNDENQTAKAHSASSNNQHDQENDELNYIQVKRKSFAKCTSFTNDIHDGRLQHASCWLLSLKTSNKVLYSSNLMSTFLVKWE